MRVFVLGGAAEEGRCFDDIWELDACTMTWQPRRHAGPPDAAAAAQGKGSY
jgi:hypothetical protein